MTSVLPTGIIIYRGFSMVSILAVFWFYKDNFYGQEDVINGKSTIAAGDYMQLDADHFFIWDRYRKRMGLPPQVDYDEIPRGRILFHILTHRFIVIGSKDIINNEKVRNQLLSYYGLPSNTEFRWDEHYC